MVCLRVLTDQFINAAVHLITANAYQKAYSPSLCWSNLTLIILHVDPRRWAVLPLSLAYWCPSRCGRLHAFTCRCSHDLWLGQSIDVRHWYRCYSCHLGLYPWFGRHTSTMMCALTSCYPTRTSELPWADILRLACDWCHPIAKRARLPRCPSCSQVSMDPKMIGVAGDCSAHT